MDISNKHMVVARLDGIYVLNPPSGPMSKDDAIALAAWLVVVAGDRGGEKFKEALIRVTAN